MHGQVECGVVVVHGADDFLRMNLGRKLFPDFALDALLWGFAFFDFTGGEFPPALPVAVAALGCKDFPFAAFLVCAQDDRPAYGYGFHSCPPSVPSISVLVVKSRWKKYMWKAKTYDVLKNSYGEFQKTYGVFTQNVRRILGKGVWKE